MNYANTWKCSLGMCIAFASGKTAWPVLGVRCMQFMRHSLTQRARCFGILVLSVFCFLSSGCITESYKDCSNNCRTETYIVECNGEYSQEKNTLSVSVRKVQCYYYEPFMESNITTHGDMQTFTYSLTTPPADAELSQWVVVPSEDAERFIEQRFDILDDGSQYYRSKAFLLSDESKIPRCRKPFILPICPVYQDENSSGESAEMQFGRQDKSQLIQKKHLQRFHEDDMHYLTRPFLIHSSQTYGYKLQIPYKIENGVYYLYSPKDSDQLFLKTFRDFKWNVTSYIWPVIITPITVTLDIVLLPVEAVGFVYFMVALASM